jgi:hypothetical protein
MNTPQFLRERRDEIASWGFEYTDWNNKYCNRKDHPVIADLIKELEIDCGEGKKGRNKNKITKSKCIELYSNDETLYKGIILSMLWGGISVGKGHLGMLLEFDKEKLENIVKATRDLLFNGEYSSAFHNFKDKKSNKIPGVDTSFFTKIFYFLALSDERFEQQGKMVPLIFDKWTMNAYASLLMQVDRINEVEIKNMNLNWNLRSPGEIKFKDEASAYDSYVKDMNNWAKAIDVTPRRLEEYLFGLPRDENDKNPRRQLWTLFMQGYGKILMEKLTK